MDFENVDVEKAKAAINQCLSSLNCNASSNIITELRGSNSWEADSKNTFLTAMDTLVNVRYKELKDYLNNCLKALNLIGDYQKVASENKSLSNSIDGNKTSISQLEKQYKDIEDKNSQEAKDKQKQIQNYKSSMNSSQGKISENKTKMSNLKSQIEALI